jgi:hypothetical protein
LDKGYRLYNERNTKIERGSETREYSTEEIRLMVLAFDDINERINQLKRN